MGNCSQCLSRGKQEVWLTSLIGLAVSKRQVAFLFCNNLCKFPILNSVLIYSFIFFFWIPFWFCLDQPNSLLIVHVHIDISLRQVVICCSSLKCPCHPMSVPQSCIWRYIFFRDVWLTWNFGSIFAGTPAMFCFNGGSLWFSEESSGRRKIFAPQRGREGRRSGIGSGTHSSIYRRDCAYMCKKSFKISVLHNGEVSPWKWWAKIENTSTGIAVDCGYLAQSQEWDLTRTQRRRLQASPNSSLDFSEMFDPWGNIKALHWNLEPVDVRCCNA